MTDWQGKLVVWLMILFGCGCMVLGRISCVESKLSRQYQGQIFENDRLLHRQHFNQDVSVRVECKVAGKESACGEIVFTISDKLGPMSRWTSGFESIDFGDYGFDGTLDYVALRRTNGNQIHISSLSKGETKPEIWKLWEERYVFVREAANAGYFHNEHPTNMIQNPIPKQGE